MYELWGLFQLFRICFHDFSTNINNIALPDSHHTKRCPKFKSATHLLFCVLVWLISFFLNVYLL